MAFLKTRSGITFTVDSFVLRHSEKTHRDFGFLTDLLVSLFLVRRVCLWDVEGTMEVKSSG